MSSDEWLRNLVDETYDLEIDNIKRLRFDASKRIEANLFNNGIYRLFSPKGYLDFPESFIKSQSIDELLDVFNWAFNQSWTRLNFSIDEGHLEILLFDHNIKQSQEAA